MADRILQRRSALHGLALPNRVGVARVSDAGRFARFIWRGDAGAIDQPFGCPLPREPMRAARVHAASRASEGGSTSRAALWLGPDEWLLLVPYADREALAAALGAAQPTSAGSVVDVSHRQVALEVTGSGAAPLLNAGCPLDLDLSAFPIDMCTRTLLAKAEIVLWRTAAETFHVEIQRSFASYVAAYLSEAMRGV